jgi:hypothetical protein
MFQILKCCRIALRLSGIVVVVEMYPAEINARKYEILYAPERYRVKARSRLILIGLKKLSRSIQVIKQLANLPPESSASNATN